MKDKFIKVTFGDECINVRMTSEIRRRFKAVCDAEGESMSSMFRRWAIIYTYNHEKGNPQLLLSPRKETSLLEEVLSDVPDKEFPMTRIRKAITIRLAKFLNKHKDNSSSDNIRLFALQNGFTVGKVREYVQLIDSQARKK